MKKIILSFILISMIAFGYACSDDNSNSGNAVEMGMSLSITSRITQQYSGNIESVRAVSGRENPSAVAVASKSHVIRYLEFSNGKLHNYKNDFVATTNLQDEDEFTNSAVFDENAVLVTQTRIIKDNSGKVTDCRGYLRSIEYRSEGHAISQNELLKSVGPMPDAVAITPDKQYAITADELDSTATWGKCPVTASSPSVSILKLDNSKGKLNLSNVKKIQFSKNAEGQMREPEFVAVASDNDTVAVTLQDSHEVAIFSLSQILALPDTTLDESTVAIYAMPQNARGDNPWPDGITSFDIGGNHYFAMAGEANDSIIIINDKGETISNTEITEKEVPPSYPCLKADDFATIKYSPDSITSFVLGTKTYVAATLRYAGAVIFYDVSTPESPKFELITRAGTGDVVNDGVCKGYESMTKVYPEGISSAPFGDAVYVWIANEGDDTVTALKLQAN